MDMNTKLANAAAEWSAAAARHRAAARAAGESAGRRIDDRTPAEVARRIRDDVAAKVGRHAELADAYDLAAKHAAAGRCAVPSAITRDPEFARYQSLVAEASAAGRVVPAAG